MENIGMVLFVVLFVTFLIFMGYSAVLMYHWFSYAKSSRAAIVASVIHMSLGFILIFIMLVAASSIT